MSEFSESYHLRTSDREAAVNLIRNSGNTGYVFAETNGWVSFLIEGANFSVNPEVIKQNPGLLVHYIFAEDHGFEFRVYRKEEAVLEFVCDWNDEVEIEDNELDLGVIRELVLLQGNSISGIEQLFEAESMFSDITPAYELAERIGLVHYAWLSADNVEEYETDEEIQVVR